MKRYDLPRQVWDSPSNEFREISFLGVDMFVLSDGAVFRETNIRESKGYEVKRQFREERRFGSRHAFELRDGSLIIDHIDHVNPESGKVSALAHFVIDHPMGRAVGAILGVMIGRKFL